ncbi:Asp23/Gls24 family envelope stress response protein [Allofustis seminis]|uniref:Asp23/Gls24 family envelope stress response protein n=1 Tax=Allofustis seminis TaxID=166939 RepID=UPI00036C3708|nr:Asp23/Gls24 family envelope stress response protein [Allofustis seminis]
MVKTYDHSKAVYGNIEISQEVLEVIAGKATHDVAGVYGTQKSFSNEVLNYFNNKEFRRGVQLTKSETGELVLDIYVNLDYGVKVSEVALAIQKNVRDQIYFMTNIHINEINVHIVGIVSVKTELADILEKDGDMK